MEADKELDELRKELADCRLDTNAGTERTLRIIIAWRNRAVKAARIDEFRRIPQTSEPIKDEEYYTQRLIELTKEEGAL